MLDNAMLKHIANEILRPWLERKAMAHLLEQYEVSQRRACKVIDCPDDVALSVC